MPDRSHSAAGASAHSPLATAARSDFASIPMTRSIFSAASALAALMLCAPASAQTPAQGPDGRPSGRLAVCRADAMRLCGAVEAGRGRRMACLMENKAKLTPECAQTVEARIAERAARGGGRGVGPASGASAPNVVPAPSTAQPLPQTGPGGGRGRMAACRTDAATFCASAEKGPARGRCLRENQAKLSPGCQAVIKERIERGKARRAAMQSDRQSLGAPAEGTPR